MVDLPSTKRQGKRLIGSRKPRPKSSVRYSAVFCIALAGILIGNHPD